VGVGAEAPPTVGVPIEYCAEAMPGTVQTPSVSANPRINLCFTEKLLAFDVYP
jgi:hypothetical protein